MVRMLTVSVIGLSTAAFLSAQAPDRPQGDPTAPPSATAPAPQQPTSQAPAAPKTGAGAGSVMMTGCVKAGSSAGSYILANVRGTSGSSSKSYNLTLKPSDDLSKHVNHKIEVTGTVSPASSGAAASSPSASAGAGASSSAAPTETFTVTSFKMVSATCP
jgi:hypothetical protein